MKLKIFQIGILQTNVYVLSEGGNALVIDPAYDKDGEVACYLTEEKLKLSAVMLTHGHFDHAGGASALARRFGAPIYCNFQDWELCARAEDNRFGYAAKNCIPSNGLKEGKLSVGGFDLEIIETPFHTTGSVVILYGEYMFSGDTLFTSDIGRWDLPESRPESIKNSLEKLKRLDKNYAVFSGHGESTTLERELAENVYLKNESI